MQLVVAEKPSVARDLARVLGVRGRGDGSFEGDRCVITWCVGHLAEQEEPHAYDERWKAWRLDLLPMIPETFRLRGTSHAADQRATVVGLLRDRRFTSVVNACDAGREGELIFRYVYELAGSRIPIQRLWVSSLTDDAIRRGFATLRSGKELEPLADAARSRSEADWLVGMNATRAVTIRGRRGGERGELYSIGRVQTPTLAMIVARDQEIRAFVPKPYWEVHGSFAVADGGFVAKWRDGKCGRVGELAIAEAIVARDRAVRGAVVETVRAKTVKEPPPLLFDLTALQRAANGKFGWSAQRTLELAQALYERHKVLSYPRTDSRHLTTDVAKELPALFEALRALPEVGRFAEIEPRAGRRIVDDSKVRDHHAIIPTGAISNSMDRDEARLFDLVVRRFLGAFYPDAEFAQTEAWIRVGEATTKLTAFAALDAELYATELPAMPDRYLARGRVRVVAGWQEVLGWEPKKTDDDEATAALPPLVEGQRLERASYAAIAKQTTPPPRYTEATLLAAMESAGRRIEDEALREAMRDAGLGTPATRAAIIETLLKRSYITREGKSLVATAVGEALIAAIPVPSLASPELTGKWEARLSAIARGEETRAAFMADITRYVTGIVDAIRGGSAPPLPPRVDGGGGGGGASAPNPAGGWSSSGSRWNTDGGNGKRGRGKKGGKSRADRGAGARSSRSSSSSSSSSASSRSSTPRSPTSRTTSVASRASSSQVSPSSPRSRGGVLQSSHPPSRTSQSSSREWDDMLVDSAARTARTAQPSVARVDRSSDAFAAAALQLGRTVGAPSAASAGTRPTSASASASASALATAAAARPAAARSTPSVHPPEFRGNAPVPTESLVCPRCKRGTLLTGARGWGCSRFREDCRFVIWFQTAGRAITETQLRDLVTRGKTRKGPWGRLVLDLESGARLEPPI